MQDSSEEPNRQDLPQSGEQPKDASKEKNAEPLRTREDPVRRALIEALKTNPFPPTTSFTSSGKPKVQPQVESKEKRQQSVQRLIEVLDPRNFRELTLEDLPAIGRLYQSREMPVDMFEHIARGEYDRADEFAQRSGGYVDRWQPDAEEENWLRQFCSNYEPSGAEFEKFLRGQHGRNADFRAFGIFDPTSHELRSICAMYTPPRDASKRKAHGDDVRRMFMGADPVRQCTTIPYKRKYDEEMQSRAESTAEFYLIGSAPHGAEGAANVAFNNTLERLKQDKIDISDFYLLHYDGFELLKPEPTASELPRMNAPNPSHNFGTGLEFWPFAMCKLADQVAARTTKSYGIVVVQPIWQVMWAHAHDVHESNKKIMQRISERVASAKTQ